MIKTKIKKQKISSTDKKIDLICKSEYDNYDIDYLNIRNNKLDICVSLDINNYLKSIDGKIYYDKNLTKRYENFKNKNKSNYEFWGKNKLREFLTLLESKKLIQLDDTKDLVFENGLHTYNYDNLLNHDIIFHTFYDDIRNDYILFIDDVFFTVNYDFISYLLSFDSFCSCDFIEFFNNDSIKENNQIELLNIADYNVKSDTDNYFSINCIGGHYEIYRSEEGDTTDIDDCLFFDFDNLDFDYDFYYKSDLEKINDSLRIEINKDESYIILNDSGNLEFKSLEGLYDYSIHLYDYFLQKYKIIVGFKYNDNLYLSGFVLDRGNSFSGIDKLFRK